VPTGTGSEPQKDDYRSGLRTLVVVVTVIALTTSGSIMMWFKRKAQAAIAERLGRSA
jgi:NADH:ubiquinone oxidoreductase subunit H